LIVIGAGRAGTTVAAVLAARTPWSVTLVARKPDRAGAVRRWVARHRWRGNLRVTPTLAEALAAVPDAALAAVPDRALADVAQELAAQWSNVASPLPIALHLSGAREPDVLRGFAGTAVGSLHPLAALPDPVQEGLHAAEASLRGALAAIDGDAEAVSLATTLARALGCLPAHIATPHRARYHAAAALAANDLVALVGIAERQAILAGLDRATCRRTLLHLSATALQRLAALDPEVPLGQGLTGAAARGDRDTLQRHLAALRDDPQAASVHRELTAAAAALAHQAGRIDAATAELISKLTKN
jgi:predicted short-subunit dehydrogenase-like oxidoreductase (DUF2520 family)